MLYTTSTTRARSESSGCWKSWSVDYRVEHYQRDPQTMLAPPSLRKLHPLGKSPVITDGDLVLAESGAIVEYLADRYGEKRLIPSPGTAQRVQCNYWLHYAEGSAMPPLLLKLVFSRIHQSPGPLLVRPVIRGMVRKVRKAFIDPQLKLHLDYLESHLAEQPWFCGESFSVADIQMSFPLEAARARAGLDDSRPRLMNFLARIHAREAYQRALERGGEYVLASRAP